MKSFFGLFAALFCLAAVHAAAEERFGTDFDALFREYADEIENFTELDGSVSEVLKLDGGTVVTRRANGQVVTAATDGQAVGCYVHLLLAAAALDAACPDVLDADEKQWLESTRERTLKYYAANIYPPQPYENVDRLFGQAALSYSPSALPSCETGLVGSENVAGYIKKFILNSRAQNLDELLSTPRLPADNPCL